MKEIVAALTAELRRSPHVNHRSGVSVRYSIGNLETLAAAAVRRAARGGEPEAVPRVCDLPAVLASSEGRVEFDTIEEGREDEILARALRTAELEVFRRRLSGFDFSRHPAAVRRRLRRHHLRSHARGRPAGAVRRAARAGEAARAAGRGGGEPRRGGERAGVRPGGAASVSAAQQGRRRRRRHLHGTRGLVVSGVPEVHKYVGFAVVAVFSVGWIWGLVTWILRRPDPGRGSGLAHGGAVVAGLQALLGIILLLLGYRPDVWLHYVYGFGPLADPRRSRTGWRARDRR